MVCFRLCVGAVALSLSSGLVAGPPGAGNENLPQESLTFDRPVPGGTLSRSCAGDFDANGEPDVALLTSAGIEVVVDVGSVSWWLQTTTGANDLSVRPRPAGEARDTFVAVGSAGATVHWMSSNQLATAAIQTGAWQGAQLVDSALTDIGGAIIEERIVGVMSDGVSLKTLHTNGVEWLSTNITLGAALPGDPSTVQIVELELVDLDGDQAIELALGVEDADDCGIAFYELDGTAIAQTYGYSNRTLTSLTSGAQANGSTFCAWTTKNQFGAEHAYVCDSAGLASTVPLATAGVVGATSAQWSSDGHADLVFSLSSGDLRVLTNLGTTAPSFALTNYTAISADSAQTAGVAEPAAGDFDFDGDVDLALALGTSEQLEFHRSSAIDHLTQAPVVGSTDESILFSAGMIEHPDCFTISPSNNPYMTHTIVVSRGTNTAATHVSYKVWRRASPSVDTDPNSETGTVLLDSNGNAVVSLQLNSPDNSGCGVFGVDSTVLYYYELQLSRPSEQIRYTPTFYGVETDSTSSVNATHLGTLSTPTPLHLDVNHGSSPPPVGGDPVVVGSLDRIRTIPGLAGGMAPQ